MPAHRFSILFVFDHSIANVLVKIEPIIIIDDDADDRAILKALWEANHK